MRILALTMAALLLVSGHPADHATVDDVAMIPVEGEGAKYWPRWRGPSGQGLAAGSGYVDTWSGTDNVKWKTPLDTTGNGSPIVWGDRIFITVGAAEGTKRGIAAFDRATGHKLWETFAPDTTFEQTNLKNGYASSTPTTDGRLVYAYLGSHGVMAVDFAGTLAWHAPVGEIMPPHGSAASPLLYKPGAAGGADRIIINQDHAKGGFIAAFDAGTGAQLWRKPRKEVVGWGTPIAIRAGARDEIVISSMRGVYAYNPDDGEELWKVAHGSPEVIPTPVVGHGLVFASFGKGGPTLAIRPGGSGDVTKTHVAWQAVKGAGFVPSPLLYGDELYMISDQTSVATAYDAKSGAVLWQGRLGDAAVNGFSASPVGVDGKVFFTNEEGDTFVLKAGRTFELLHVNKLNAPVLASPAMVDGTWYFRTPFHLMAVGATQGRPDFSGTWKPSDSFNRTKITVEGSTMTVTITLAGNSDSTVYRLDGTPSKKTIKGPGGKLMEQVYTSTWDGNVLVTTITTPGPNPMIEKRSIEADGTMKVERTIVIQGRSETNAQVLRKID